MALIGRGPFELTELYATNAPRALAQAHTLWHAELTRVARRIVRSTAAAEDIVQESFTRLTAQPALFSGRSSLKTFLYRMVVNKSIDSVRTVQRRNELEARFLPLGEPAVVPEETDSVDDRVVSVKAALAGIADAYRIPFELAVLEGLSYLEIGSVLSLPINTVRTRIYRCRERVAHTLRNQGVSV